MTMRGPKVELVLQRYTSSSDDGGGIIKSWTSMRKIKGVLAFIGADERERASKETLQLRYHFWCNKPKGLDITTKDEFSRVGSRFRYRIIYVDDILEKGITLKIDLIQIR